MKSVKKNRVCDEYCGFVDLLPCVRAEEKERWDGLSVNRTITNSYLDDRTDPIFPCSDYDIRSELMALKNPKAGQSVTRTQSARPERIVKCTRPKEERWFDQLLVCI